MAGPAGNRGGISPCCYQHAVSDGAGYCGECSKPLLRCMAFKECGGLVGYDGLCSVCVRPQLFLDKSAVTDVKAGGVLVLPLIFRNAAAIERPLMISDVWVREGGAEPRPLKLPWKWLEPRSSNRLDVQTGALERQGRYAISISFAATINYFWREERYAYESSLSLNTEQSGSVVIHQTINTSGSGAGSDTVYAPIRLEQLDRTRRPGASTDTSEESELALQRADNLDIEYGLRGYKDGSMAGKVVSRGARLIWQGFAKNDAPMDGPINTKDGLIALGRAKTIAEGGDGHVRLEIVDATGVRDEQLSLAISRRHFEFLIQDGRLYVRATGQAGLMINGRKLGKGVQVGKDGQEAEETQISFVSSGDVIKVLPKYGDALALRVRMQAYGPRIEEITITRVPSMPEASR